MNRYTEKKEELEKSIKDQVEALNSLKKQKDILGQRIIRLENILQDMTTELSRVGLNKIGFDIVNNKTPYILIRNSVKTLILAGITGVDIKHNVVEVESNLQYALYDSKEDDKYYSFGDVVKMDKTVTKVSTSDVLFTLKKSEFTKLINYVNEFKDARTEVNTIIDDLIKKNDNDRTSSNGTK